jgi:hypothetical protein
VVRLLVAAGWWVVSHWWIGTPAILGVLLLGRAIVRWAVRTRCDVGKRLIGDDPKKWAMVGSQRSGPGEHLRFAHLTCTVGVSDT